MKKFKSLIFVLSFLLIETQAFAVGKVLAPFDNQTSMSIGGRRSNGDAIPLAVDNSGNLLVSGSSSSSSDDATNGVTATAIKPLATSTYNWTRFVNYGANVTLNVKSSSGNIKSLYCHNLNNSSRYIQIFNTATVPSNGNVPAFSFLVSGAGTTLIDGAFFGENGYNFSSGIAFAFSTTETTYTAGSAGDQVTIIMSK